MNINTLEHFLVAHCDNDITKCRQVLEQICDGKTPLRLVAGGLNMSESQLSRKKKEFTTSKREISPIVIEYLDTLEYIRKPQAPDNIIKFRA